VAQRKPVIIDGEFTEVSPSARLSEVTRPDVKSVLTSEGRIIPRADFARWPVPDGFETNLTAQVKG
jgi:hypothetical protein